MLNLYYALNLNKEIDGNQFHMMELDKRFKKRFSILRLSSFSLAKYIYNTPRLFLIPYYTY